MQSLNKNVSKYLRMNLSDMAAGFKGNETKKSLVDLIVETFGSLSIIGYVFLVLLFLGVLQNAYIFVAFYLNKQLRSFYHTLIMWLMLVNFFGILTQYPAVIAGKLSSRLVLRFLRFLRFELN